LFCNIVKNFYLRVFQRIYEEGGPSGRYDGFDLPPQYTSRTTQINLRFKSDFSVTYSGFEANFLSVPGGKITFKSHEK